MSEALINILSVLLIICAVAWLFACGQFAFYTWQAWREFRQEREDEKREGKFDLPDNCKKCKARHKCWADAVEIYVKRSVK